MKVSMKPPATGYNVVADLVLPGAVFWAYYPDHPVHWGTVDPVQNAARPVLFIRTSLADYHAMRIGAVRLDTGELIMLPLHDLVAYPRAVLGETVDPYVTNLL